MVLGRANAVFLGIVVAVLAVALVFHVSLPALLNLWSMSSYQHGALAIPIALVLIYMRREALARQKLAPSWIGAAAFVLLAAVWYVMRAYSIQVLEQAALVGMIPAAVLATMGPAVCRACVFPLLFMFAAVPFGEDLVPPLMKATADISTWLLWLVGIPAYREDMLIMLPGGTFEVIETCAGLRYLLAGMILGVLFCYLNYRTPLKWVVFLAATATVLIVGNGIRAFIVMVVASATNLKHFAGEDHVVFGTIFFAFLCVLLCWIGTRYADKSFWREAHA